MKLKLEMELVPNSSWGISLANKLPKEDWDKLRREVYKEAGYKCQICGAFNTPVHCHEVWKFDDRARTQKLVRLECLCGTCHDVKHFGRSVAVHKKAYVEKLIQHWMKVNKKTRRDFEIYQMRIREIYRRRADKVYTVQVGRTIIS